MRQDVIGDDARRFNGMYAWLDRQVRERGIHFRDRVQANESLSCPAAAQEKGLRVMRLALLEAATRTLVSKKISDWLCFQNGLNPLLAHLLKIRSQFAPGSALPWWTHRPSTLTMEGRYSTRLRSMPSGCSIASSSMSGLKPSLSRRALGMTIRPALSILSSIPLTIPYAIKSDDDGKRIRFEPGE